MEDGIMNANAAAAGLAPGNLMTDRQAPANACRVENSAAVVFDKTEPIDPHQPQRPSMSGDVFGGQHIDALVALGVARSYPKNAVLAQAGDVSDQFYILLSGKLKVFLADDDGKEIVVDILSPRQCFGEMALDGAPRSASVMTMEPSRLAVIQHDDLKKFLAAHPDAAFALIVTLIRRARNLTRTIGNLALLDVYGRVARLLVDNASDEAGRLMVAGRMSQQEIAQRIGSSREMVSRILTDLKAGGYITMDEGRIVIKQALPKRW
jgi:CRP/FNR family cyclic AMP-dependent transcriptional regulator